MKAINIKWDTDGDEDLLKSLPKEIEIPKHLIGEDVAEDYADEISDYISQVTGYCHFGFDLVDDDFIKLSAEVLEEVGEFRAGTYNIGFNDGDETQFDVHDLKELWECWKGFCAENGFQTDSIDYVEFLNCESKSKLIDGVTSCCGYDFGVDIEKANYCPICGKKGNGEEKFQGS